MLRKFMLRKFHEKKSLKFCVFCKNQWIFTNNIVFQDKPQFTFYVICDVYQFISFRDHRNAQDTVLYKLSQFFNHLFFIKFDYPWNITWKKKKKEKNNFAIREIKLPWKFLPWR